MDMMSDIDNLDVMLGNGNENPIERELADAIEQSSTQEDYETNNFKRPITETLHEEMSLLGGMTLGGPLRPFNLWSTGNSNLLSNGINTNKDAQCSFCKATGHYYNSCPN